MAGKQLSRLTSQDRVLTANDLFDPNERPHGAVMALKETKSLVDHSTQAHIFATKAELDAFVAEQSALSEAERTVKVGDNLYITDTGVPDYWWMGEAPWVSELETGAVNVTVEQVLNESRNPVSAKAVYDNVGNVARFYPTNCTHQIGNKLSQVILAGNGAEGDTNLDGGFMAVGSSSAAPNWRCWVSMYQWHGIKAWPDDSGVVDIYSFKRGTDDQIVRRKDLEGLGGGGFDPEVSEIAIGLKACACGNRSIAIGESAWAYGASHLNGGVAIGRRTNATEGAVAIGGSICENSQGARAECYSVAIGSYTGACKSAVAVGYQAKAYSCAVAVGGGACAGYDSVTIGENACTGNRSVAIGLAAGGGCTGAPSVVIGPRALNDTTPDGTHGFYPIVIGTSCYAMGDHLVNATIRVDTEGNLTVGGKPVGGGGDSAVEVWKGNVGFGEQDTFIGAKKTADGDGQFQNGYPRLHNHGQDIHEVSGFSRDSYENECMWSHRFLIPWDLAKANDTSYMAANVKWQGNRNLLQMGDETTFVQPLMPVNTGNTSSKFPYAIPAFEESPVYWSGTVIYNDSQDTSCAGSPYTDYAKMVSVPWAAMYPSETVCGGYNFMLYRRSIQPYCQIADGVLVSVTQCDGSGVEIALASQDYVKTLEQRIQALETKLAAVGA